MTRARDNYVRVLSIPYIRGAILDRNGEALAEDRAAFNIAVIPYQIEGKMDTLFEKLAIPAGLSEAKLYRNYKRNFEGVFSPVDIIVDVDKETALKIKEQFNDSVLINPQPRRYYSYPYECSHILGYVKEAGSLPGSEDLQKYGYSLSERVGAAGLEKYYDMYLKGEDGGDLIEVDSRGKTVGFLGERQAQNGKSIQLTIDARIQKAAYDSLAGKTGAVLMMNSQTGEILAAVSSPSYDPNDFMRGKNAGAYLLSDTKPMLNRFVQSVYPIGSTFKPVMAVAALEEEKITPYTSFDCTGRFSFGRTSFKCWNTHGIQDLEKALAHSCNFYFYTLGKMLGGQIMSRWAGKFGFNKLSGIDLPYERKGVVPEVNGSSFTLGDSIVRSWFGGDNINFAIGQGYMQITPMELLVGINAIADGGYLVRPHFLKKVDNVESEVSSRSYLGISRVNLDVVKKGMAQVVHAADGTARILKPLDLKVAGKTGTAQNPGIPHGWFVGFFPYDNPRYSFLVFTEHSGASYESVKVAVKFLSVLKEQNIFGDKNDR